MTAVYRAFALRIHDRPDKLQFSLFVFSVMHILVLPISFSVTGTY